METKHKKCPRCHSHAGGIKRKEKQESEMKQPKISVIIPVYNGEKYLARCIDSVLQQTICDFEIILIDDGSKDNSPHICDDYAEKDARISVVHKENGGVSSARNVGIKQAKGEYITFVDSDDTLPIDAFANLLKPINAHPMVDVVCGSSTVFGSKGNIMQTWILPFTDNERYIHTFDMWAFFVYCVWGKLIRRDLVVRHGLWFEPSITSNEDVLWLHFLQKKVKSIAQCCEIVYEYHSDNNESIVHSKDKTFHYLQLLDAVDVAIRHFDKNYLNETIFVYELLSVHRLANDWPDMDQIKVKQRLKELHERIKACDCSPLVRYQSWLLTRACNPRITFKLSRPLSLMIRFYFFMRQSIVSPLGRTINFISRVV